MFPPEPFDKFSSGWADAQKVKMYSDFSLNADNYLYLCRHLILGLKKNLNPSSGLSEHLPVRGKKMSSDFRLLFLSSGLVCSFVCMYVCTVITYSKYKDQSGKVANPARGQLNWEHEYFPVRVRA